MNTDLQYRKQQLEARLASHGIKDYQIKHLPYLEFDPKTFATPYDAGCRMMICYAVAYATNEPDDRDGVIAWLKREKLWKHVAPSERALFAGKVTEERKLIDLSWQGECAYILAWALDLIKDIPSPTEPLSDAQLDLFMDNVPALGDELKDLLANLSYRDTTEIFDENLFHELVTTYFRNLLFSGKENTSDIDPHVSFLRHQTLNWLRRFMGIDEWDETDTAT